MQNIPVKKPNKDRENEPLPENPVYPPGEDIYSKAKGESIDEDNSIRNDLSKNLDVPGSELDDANKLIGDEDEDEENDYYTLGGES